MTRLFLVCAFWLGAVSGCGEVLNMTMNSGTDSECSAAVDHIKDCCPKIDVVPSCFQSTATTSGYTGGNSIRADLAPGQSRCLQARPCTQIRDTVRARDELCGFEFNHAKHCDGDDPKQPRGGPKPSEAGD
jgi:hypothetical protein